MCVCACLYSVHAHGCININMQYATTSNTQWYGGIPSLRNLAVPLIVDTQLKYYPQNLATENDQ